MTNGKIAQKALLIIVPIGIAAAAVYYDGWHLNGNNEVGANTQPVTTDPTNGMDQVPTLEALPVPEARETTHSQGTLLDPETTSTAKIDIGPDLNAEDDSEFHNQSSGESRDIGEDLDPDSEVFANADSQVYETIGDDLNVGDELNAGSTLSTRKVDVGPEASPEGSISGAEQPEKPPIDLGGDLDAE